MRNVHNTSLGPHIAAAILRAVFAVIFAVTGFLLGREAYVYLVAPHFAVESLQLAFTIGVPLAGAVLGLFVAPAAQSIFEKELNAIERAIERLAPYEIAGGALGLIAGLVIAFLIRSVLFEFISTTGRSGSYVAILLYIVLSVFFAYLGARVGARKIVTLSFAGTNAAGSIPKIIDTSIIVDGRIVEILQAGFLEGPFILPRFILRELQAVADSADALKRTRGRRGLDVLNRLQEMGSLEISEIDYDGVR